MIVKNQEYLFIILFIIIAYLTYRLNKLENREKFTTASTAPFQEQITTAVKKIYLADVEAIRILSNFAIQLSQGGTTIPGNVIFSGRIGVNSKNPDDLPTSLSGGLIASNIYSDGTIATGKTKVVNASINSDGNINARNLTLTGNSTITGNSTVTGSLKIGSWTLTEDISGNLIFNNNTSTSLVKIDSSGSIFYATNKGKLGYDNTNGIFLTNNAKGGMMFIDDTGTVNISGTPRINIAGLAGYYFSGESFSDAIYSYPIICSRENIDGENSDDYWLINPGYRVLAYTMAKYNGDMDDFNNLNGTKPKLYSSKYKNSISSFRVYFVDNNKSEFKYTEIKF